MKIVVIGGTGLIGTQLCNNLRATQFFEFIGAIAQTGAEGGSVLPAADLDA